MAKRDGRVIQGSGWGTDAKNEIERASTGDFAAERSQRGGGTCGLSEPEWWVVKDDQTTVVGREADGRAGRRNCEWDGEQFLWMGDGAMRINRE
jgi:hypothetical protein